MKNICFIANFEKTSYFSAIADNILKQQGYKVYWIVVNKKQHTHLKSKYGNDKVCLINKENLNYDNSSNFILTKFKFNEFLLQDRSLNTSSTEDWKYLKSSTLKIYNFIKNNKIQFIYGEITWAHELICFNISKKFKELNCKFYYPSTIRFPLNRFVFFTNENQSEYFIRKNKQNVKLDAQIGDYLNLVEKIKPKSIFFSKNFLFFKFKKLFFESYFDKHDPTKINKLNRIYKLIQKYLNFLIFYIINKVNLNKLENKKYVVYFLQKKPEAAIDVKGIYYENQFINFLNIWRLLPSDFKIILKEHPNSIGDNSYFFYRKFLNLNNAYLIDDKVDFNRLISNSFATFSVASSASFQSALKNIPSFTLAKTYFNEFKYSSRISIEDLKSLKDIYDLTELFLKNDYQKKNFESTTVMQNSFEGFLIGNDRFNKNNLELVTAGFLETTLDENEIL